MKKLRTILTVIAVISAVFGLAWYWGVGPLGANTVRRAPECSCDSGGSASQPATQPSAAWAKPVALKGVDNFFQVSPHLYRGEQPTEEGFRNLKAMGIKTIVCLRFENDDRDDLRVLGLEYLHIPMNATRKPRDEQAVKFLALFADPAKLPVFVHCRQGADRTGTMCALYRMVWQDWPREKALEEMTRGGFGYHKMFDDLPEYVQACDISLLRRRASATSAPATQPR